MKKLTKFEIINKIKSKELSLEECINVLSNDNCWEFPKTTDKKQVKGVLGIFVLKRILEFFPTLSSSYNVNNNNNIINVKSEFEKILKEMDFKKTSLILKELITFRNGATTSPNREIVEWNNSTFTNSEVFNIFKNSPTYIKLYNKINYLFSILNLNEDVQSLTEEEEQELFTKFPKKEDFLIHKKKLERKKLEDHVKDLIFYSQVLNKFYCSIFTKNYNIKDDSLILILPVDYKISKVNLDNLFNTCEKTEKFFLNLQIFMYKYLVDNIYLYSKKYEERANFINNIIYNIDSRYPHLLCTIIEKKYKKFYKNTCNINSKDFTKVINSKKEKLKKIFRTKKMENLKILDDLILIFYIKTWFDKILDISDWPNNYLHLDVFDKKLNFKRINGEFYPIIVNLFYTCWGVLFRGSFYIGNIVYVLFKYKEIIKDNFNLELKKSSQAMKTISIKNFLVFKKKK